MATNKKKALNKAFVSIGKVSEKQADGTKKQVEKFIILPEELAKFVGVPYTTAAPAPRKVEVKNGLLKGRTYLKEVSVKITGRIYKVGYVDGLRPKVGDRPRQVKIKWISLFVTNGITLRVLLKAIRSFKKKPVYFKTPDGVTTRFVY
jgi:hypothetical protein